MPASEPQRPSTPCLCTALRRASRAVSRIYDDELRGVNLRGTQYSLLVALDRLGEVRHCDLGEIACLEESSLTRNLRPLTTAGWIEFRPGDDRREKLLRITAEGKAKLKEARGHWLRAQDRMKQSLPNGLWQSLMTALPDVTSAAVAG